MSARRIDQTDHVPGLMKSQSRFLCPGSGGFEAGVNRLAGVFTEPRDECRMTRCVIGENLVTRLAAFLQQSGIQSAFADIDP